MRLDRNFLGWGTFLITLGIVPLAVQLGWVDRSTVGGLWQLWPLFLIAAGVGLVLRRTRFAGLGGVLAAGTAGLLLGGILTGGVNFGTACGSGGGATVDERSGTLTPGAGANLDISCGRLTVGTSPGDAWKVAWGPAGATAPSIAASSTSLRMKSPEGGVSVFPWSTGSTWNVTLPQASVTRLGLHVNAGSATAPLDGVTLDALSVSVNAGDLRVDLGSARATTIDADVNVGTLRLGVPPAGPTSGRIGANLSSVVVCAAQGVSLRITVKPSLSSVDLPGLTRVSENVYQSEGWTPGTGVDLRIESNLGSVRLDRGGTCR
jgi:hypothetical protein